MKTTKMILTRTQHATNRERKQIVDWISPKKIRAQLFCHPRNSIRLKWSSTRHENKVSVRLNLSIKFILRSHRIETTNWKYIATIKCNKKCIAMCGNICFQFHPKKKKKLCLKTDTKRDEKKKIQSIVKLSWKRFVLRRWKGIHRGQSG